MSDMEPLKQAIKQAGGEAALAKAIGVTPQFMGQMLKGRRPIPPGRCIQIETAVKGAVTRYQLRPDIFGPGPAPHQTPVPEQSARAA